MVTIFGIGLCIWASVMFFQGNIAGVTATSSHIGNLLDHGTDIIHPPIWWACLGMGLLSLSPELHHTHITIIGYIFGRFIETRFKSKFGFNAYLWQPFDSKFRLIISRRNVNLVILTLGMLSGQLLYSFYIVAVWRVLSLIIQAARLALAERRHKAGEEITIFLAQD